MFNAVTVLSSGDIVAVGTVQNPTVENADSVVVAEYSSSGALMTGSFGTETTPGDSSTRSGYVLTVTGGRSYATSVAALSDGDILVAGYDVDNRNGILAEYDSTGTLVPTFGSLGIVRATDAGWDAMAVLSDGDILVAGYQGFSDDPMWTPSIAVAEYSSDSHLVSTFGTGGIVTINIGNDAAAYGLTVLSDGTILLSGHGQESYLDTDNTQQHRNTLFLVELNENGVPISTFGDNGVAMMLSGLDAAVTGYAIAQLPDNIIAVVGKFKFDGDSNETAFVAEYELTPQTTTYGYDVRNKLVSYSDATNSASYVYDDAGNRVAETVASGGTSTTSFYLTDEENPTGYAQPLEVWTSSDNDRSDATLSQTYILGDRILGQVDSSGNVSYLLIDGHGSTQQITDSEGFVTSTFSYDAFGTALNFNAATAGTQILFGGDAIYDPASGLYMHGDGVRDTLGFLFIQMDPTQGSSNDPISLHKYLYANTNPVDNTDPSGYDGILDYVSDVVDAVEAQSAATAALAVAIGTGDLGWGFASGLFLATTPESSDAQAFIDSLVTNAKNKVGSTDWNENTAGEDLCNVFVADMIIETGGSLPGAGIFHFRPPLAGQWADPAFNIPHWHVVPGGPSQALPGDVLAEKVHYSDATGHVGIVLQKGELISASSAPGVDPPGKITISDYGFRPDNYPGNVGKESNCVIRRYTDEP